MATAYPAPAPVNARKPMWKRKGLRVTVILVVILAGLLVLTDRIAASIAEDKVAQLVSQQAGTNGVTLAKDPEVDVTGFPFLTQVFGGEYQQIDIAFTDVTASGIVLPELNVHAVNVTAEMSDVLNGSGPVTAQTMTADARITYDSIATALEDVSDMEITPNGDGTLGVAATLDVFGTQVPVSGTAEVALDGGVVTLTVTDLEADGVEVPPGGQQIVDDFAATLSRQIELPTLPYDLQLEELRTEADAIVISASAQNVPLA